MRPLVWPGRLVKVTTPMASQVALSRPVPVPAMDSRARKPEDAADGLEREHENDEREADIG